jgi:hypothetical protein
MEEYNRKRLKSLRMSRRELRGDCPVEGDPEADLPQFVRHLDTINYRSYMPDFDAPSGDAVYHSKRNHWQYSRTFLLSLGRRCEKSQILNGTSVRRMQDTTLHFARTNLQKAQEREQFTSRLSWMSKDPYAEWHALKARILELIVIQQLDLSEIKIKLKEEHDFEATLAEYETMAFTWTKGRLSSTKEARPKSPQPEIASSSSNGDRPPQFEDGEGNDSEANY